MIVLCINLTALNKQEFKGLLVVNEMKDFIARGTELGITCNIYKIH